MLPPALLKRTIQSFGGIWSLASPGPDHGSTNKGIMDYKVRFGSYTLVSRVIDPASSHRWPQLSAKCRALLLGLAILGLLWLISIPYRQDYVPNSTDIPALADGLLLAPGANWKDWFTSGYSHFWDRYPEWPLGVTGFTRPAFQFIIYLAHFAFGRNWAWYQLISCFAAAGMAAIAFQISQTILRLRTGPSVLAAVLVVLSPPVLESWLFGLAFAIEPIATLFVAGAFFAVVARRDLICLMLLFAAMLTKENAVWAPLAAAISIILRPKGDESLRHRVFVAAAMFLPVAMWMGLRLSFFGGIGGTYATAGYTPILAFIKLTFHKLLHLHYLLLTPDELATEGRWVELRNVISIGSGILIYALLCLWALRILAETTNYVRQVVHGDRLPTADASLLITIWVTIALAFHFAIPLSEERYATSIVVFAWPALVGEVERSKKAIVWLGLTGCFVISLVLSSHLSIVFLRSDRKYFETMTDVIRQAPATTRQVYVVSAGSLQGANPEYARLILGITPEIVRVVDIGWNCKSSDLVAFNHGFADGVVSVAVTLPSCANFRFSSGRIDGAAFSNGRLYRNATMNYDLPEAHPIKPAHWWEPALYLGRRMTVHVRPNGQARFIIEHGGPDGIAWFDVP